MGLGGSGGRSLEPKAVMVLGGWAGGLDGKAGVESICVVQGGFGSLPSWWLA